MKIFNTVILLAVLLASCFSVQEKSLTPATAIQNAVQTQKSFELHPAIVSDIPNFSLTLAGHNILSNLKQRHAGNKLIEFRAFNVGGCLSARTIARVYSGKPYVDFWVYVIYGHTSCPTPIFTRVPLSVEIKNGTNLELIVLDAPEPGKHIGHGQGLPLKFFRYDFSTDKGIEPSLYQDIGAQTAQQMAPFFLKPKAPWITDPVKALEEARKNYRFRQYKAFNFTDYCIPGPGMSGDQSVFGVNHLLPEIYAGKISLPMWRALLYNEGCRPGHFVHTNGDIVQEEDYPTLVMDSGGWFNFKCWGYPSWIKHTIPGEPWHDKMAESEKFGTWNFWDHEHWALSPLCQVYRMTGDPGLELLIEHIAETFFFTTPVEAKGTTHHMGSGAPRAKGRQIQACAELYYSVHDQDLKKRLQDRLNALVRIQINEWDFNVANNKGFPGTPGVVGHRDAWDGYRPWEHGLWVKGIMAALPLMDADNQARMREIGFEVSKWILNKGFVWYTDHWGTPPFLPYDGGPPNAEMGGLTRWCMPSMEILNAYGKNFLTQSEKTKLTQILDHHIKNYPKTINKWDMHNFSRWLIF